MESKNIKDKRKKKQVDLKRLVKIATEMRKEKSMMLDITSLSAEEASLITLMMHDDEIYEFFFETQDIPGPKILAIMKFLEAQENLLKMG